MYHKKNSRRKKISALISDFLSGACSTEELKKELATHSLKKENINLLLQLRYLFEKSKRSKPLNTADAWQQVNQKLKKNPRQTLHFHRYAPYAAIFIMLLCVSGLFIIQNYKTLPAPDECISQIQLIPPDSSHITLRLSDGKIILLDAQDDAKTLYDGGTNLHASSTSLSYERNTISQKSEEILNTINVPHAKTYKVSLSDGTVVWLNSGSELTYPIQFGGRNRHVSLKGEAYFAVAQKKDKTNFLVETEKGIIEVTGTEFNISSYHGSCTWHCTLVNGSVTVKGLEGEKEITLEASQQVRLEDSHLSVDVVSPYMYTSWRDGVFIFENRTLREIMERVTLWYDIKIGFANKEISEERFTGHFKQKDDFENLLDIMEATKRIKIQREEQEVIFKTK